MGQARLFNFFIPIPHWINWLAWVLVLYFRYIVGMNGIATRDN